MHTALCLILTLVALGSNCLLTASAAETSGAPIATSSAPNSAERMRTVYLGLVQQSIVPANPRVIAAAALAKLATLSPERVLPLPAWFGVDAKRDAAWLAERVVDLPPPWLVLDAMARAAATAHVGLGSPQRRQGIGALMSGKPRVAPGFNFYPLADGRLVVFDVFPGASAAASGLRAGDVLHSIDGVPAARVDVFLLNALPAGTELKLAIERAGRPATITLRLIQADVPSVESRLLDGGIGYVIVRWFARSDDAMRDTAALARRAFIALATQGARGLIIDLRSALGGSGEAAIASALCDGDAMYAIQQPLSAPARPVKREGERIWPDRPIAILVNEHTVSAGEALALSLRELAHAKIVGKTTGGGLTEMLFVPLADGYALTIPNGVVLGPISGKDQPGHAIKPDIEVPNQSIAELLNRRDPQLEAAKEALN